MSELVRAWLDNHSAHGGAHRLDELVHEAPDEALELSLEIIRRGPAYQLSSYDTMSPLLEVVQEHGSRVVERIEAAAESSVAVRRALSRLRVQLERSEQAEMAVSRPVGYRATDICQSWRDGRQHREPAARVSDPFAGIRGDAGCMVQV